MKNRKLFLKLGLLGVGLLSSSVLLAQSVGNFALSGDNIAMAEERNGSFYKIAYDATDISLKMSGDIRDYAHVSVQDLRDMKNDLTAALEKVVTNSIDVVSDSIISPTVGQLTGLTWTPKMGMAMYVPTTGIDVSLLEKMVEATLTTGGVADIDKIDNFDEDMYGSYDLIVSYYADKYAESHPSDPRDDILADIKGVVGEKAQQLADDAYTAAGDPSGAPDLQGKINDAVDNIPAGGVDINIDSVTLILEVAQDAIDQDPSIDVHDLVSDLGAATVGNEIKDLMINSDADKIKDLLITVRPEIVGDVVDAVNFDSNDITDLLDNVGMSKLMDVAQVINADGLRAILSNVSGYTAGDFRQYVLDHFSQISIKDLLKACKDIKVNGNLVMQNNVFKKQGILDLLRDLPRPSELKNRADADMYENFHIVLATTFGDIEVNLTLGFYGDCGLIRRVMSFIDNVFDFSYSSGTLKLHVDAKDYLAKAIRKISNSTVMPDEMKVRIFKFAFSTFEEMYNRINTKLLSEWIADFQSIDYAKIAATVMSADELNSLFNVSSFTDDRIDQFINLFGKIVRKAKTVSYESIKNLIEQLITLSTEQSNKLENLYDKVINLLDRIDAAGIDADLLRALIDPNDTSVTNQNIYDKIANLANHDELYTRLQNLVTRIYNKIPDSIKSHSIMDYYSGNGVFNYAGTKSFDLHNILTTISNSYGERIYNAISGFVDTIPSSISVDLQFKAADMYSVEYNYTDTESFKGMLPSGVDAVMYADRTSIGGHNIIKWVDENGDEVTSMPARDVKLYPVLDFDVVISSDSESKTYDGLALNISVDVAPVDAYTYQWKKDGVDVAGATSDSLDIVDVIDSGSYTCVVTRTSDGYSKESDPCVVTISKADIDVSSVDWDYVDAFTYDGSTKTVVVDPTTLPDHVDVNYTNNSAVNAGDYHAVAELSSNSNYNLVGLTTLELDWTINKADIDVSGVVWNYTDPFTYDGLYKTVEIDPTTLPDHVDVAYENNSKRYAGSYTATAVLTAATNNYNIVGTATITLDWVINQAEVDISGIEWDYTSPFTYDGNIYTVGLDPTTVPDHVVITYTFDTTKISAGNYTGVVYLDAENANYKLVGGNTTLTLDWVINQAEIAISGVAWDYVNPFTYDGLNKVVGLIPMNYPDFVTVEYSGVYSAANAGTYNAVATIVSVNENYKLTGTLVYNLSWKINQAEIDVSGVAFNYDGAFDYDGYDKNVFIDTTTLPDHVAYAYDGTITAVNAGSYIAKLVLSAENANYKLVGNTTITLNWKINQIEIDVSGVQWNYNTPFTYTGIEYGVDVDPHTVPMFVVVTLDGDLTGTNAGNYVATATLSALDAVNYVLVGNTTITCNWTINQAEITSIMFVWDYVNPFTYDGEEKEVGVILLADDSILTLSYNGDTSATNAGSYTVTVTFTVIDANYVLNFPASDTISWEILKAKVDGKHIRWDYSELNPFTYDGTEKEVAIKANSIPEGVVVTYTGTTKATEIGSYNATASFSLEASYQANYELINASPISLNWKIVDKVLPETIRILNSEEVDANGDYLGVVETTDADCAQLTLHVKLEDIESVDVKAIDWSDLIKGAGELHAYYDITLVDANGNVVHVNVDSNGNLANVNMRYTVKVLIPEEYRNIDRTLKIVYINEENKAVDMHAKRVGNYMVFTTTHFSHYALVTIGKAANMPWWLLAIAVVAVGVIAFETFVIVVRGKKKKGDE